MDELKRMATRPGFVEVFWKRLYGCRSIGRQDTMQQIYNKMEEEFEAEYGGELFPSYTAFKKYFYRHR